MLTWSKSTSFCSEMCLVVYITRHICMWDIHVGILHYRVDKIDHTLALNQL